ncbi:hypothetical protein [Pseudomonas vancouverensis]|uniref:Uncharacterized protein n=1 Tax=Pseudomonas vancouverensis TaxID=95300 RepID=A0A1H2MMC9_PSEVA|nr:hypothetical protein [Pseudomonas vancouverensis]KAB0494673.1 hypothetical protein F7R09_18655 [Pseudomonas vancouverensis]TDB59339.1 hypothetical protein EIY72_20060 [Pseudomonas vancouverensis]SDU94400.1 hypothetical protein SAMN05216558_0989 [Pseudomonas vancouverensis]
MRPEPEGTEEEGPNDPGNEDPGSLMDDATVPLSEADDTPEYPLPSPTDPLGRDQLPLEEDAGEDQPDRAPAQHDA